MGRRYRHFKGKEYELLCLGKHSETMEDMVIYQAMYGENTIWTRPASMFFSDVYTPEGRTVKRFQEIPDTFMIEVTEDITLRHIREEDGNEIFRIIDSYRKEMRTWLPFVDKTLKPEDSCSFAAQAENSDEESFAILFKEAFAGIIGFKNTDWNNFSTEIGYWLSPEFQKMGIMTKCVKMLCQYAFNDLGLHRIVIRCAQGNVPSRLIPIRLGFSLEGMEKDGELLCDGQYTDIEVYAKISQ